MRKEWPTARHTQASNSPLSNGVIRSSAATQHHPREPKVLGGVPSTAFLTEVISEIWNRAFTHFTVFSQTALMNGNPKSFTWAITLRSQWSKLKIVSCNFVDFSSLNFCDSTLIWLHCQLMLFCFHSSLCGLNFVYILSEIQKSSWAPQDTAVKHDKKEPGFKRLMKQNSTKEIWKQTLYSLNCECKCFLWVYY